MLIRYYEWIKAFHVIFMVCWMAGMFYLPRLFVYHTKVSFNSAEDQLFKIMEKKLLRIIINPAMILTLISGILLASLYGWGNLTVWFHIKFSAVIALCAMHGLFIKCRKGFERGENKYSEKFYRIINEVPAVLMIIAIIMVIVKPFD